MNYYKSDIRHTKGDTYSFPFIVENLHQDLDSVYFTCRDSLNDDSEVLFQKDLNDGISIVDYDQEHDIRNYVVRIAPDDTVDLQAGVFYYDLQIEVNSDIFTIMKGLFIIEQDCTRESE